MSKVEQALREYRAAVARSMASQEARDSEPHEGREKSSKRYPGKREAYSSSDDVMVAWARYLSCWAEEGTGAWWAPFLEKRNKDS